jgi:uncharacterized protein YijF (DUF1287 family)
LALEPSRPQAPRKLIARPAWSGSGAPPAIPDVGLPASSRGVVDIAAIKRHRQAKRDSAQRRSAAALLLAPLALASLVLANPFGGRTPAPEKIALPRQPLPAPDISPPARVAKAPVAPAEQAVVMPRPAAQTQVAVAPTLPLSDPPDGHWSEAPRTANPPLRASAPSPAPAVVAALPAPHVAIPPDPPAIVERPVVPPGAAITLTVPPAVISTDPPEELGRKLVLAAKELTKIPGGYDPKYLKISYPMGDVPEGWGVCSDVIVRAFRGLGVDLQQLVHTAKLGSGDSNVDHRRVTVLMKFFEKNAQRLAISPYPENYRAGDVVAYDVPWGRSSKWHIAIVTDQLSPSLRPMIVHNRGYGAKLEDALFHKRIIGHYRLDAAGLNALHVKMQPVQSASNPETKPDLRILARASMPRS